MDIKKIRTADLHTHSQRLFAYLGELTKQKQNVEANMHRVQGFDMQKLSDKVDAEIDVVTKLVQRIHNELTDRLEKDFNVKLNADGLMEDFNSLYEVLHHINQSEINIQKGNLKVQA